MDKEWQQATKQGDLEKVRLLIQKGVDIDAKDQYGQTALMNAAHAGQVELVHLLVEQGADLDHTAKYNLSALMLALIAHHSEVARLLIEASADVNISGNGSFSGKTALVLAEDGGHDDIAALIRQKGTIAQS